MKRFAKPLAPIACVVINMPGHKEGKTIQMTQRDAVSFAALNKVKIVGEVEYLPEPIPEDEATGAEQDSTQEAAGKPGSLDESQEVNEGDTDVVD